MDAWNDSKVDVVGLDDTIHAQECYITCSNDDELEALLYALWTMPFHNIGFNMDASYERMMKRFWRTSSKPWGLRYHFYTPRPAFSICAGDMPTYDIPEFNMSQFIVPDHEPEDMELSDGVSMAELFG